MLTCFLRVDRAAIKSGFLFCIFLLGLSPILKTLTEDFALDSIFALATFLFLLNLAFHDYSSHDTTLMKYCLREYSFVSYLN